MSRSPRANKSPPHTSTPRKRASDRRRALIPEPFHMIESSSVTTRAGKTNVPKLVLCGAWLKAVGFPIGSAAIVTTDGRGELTLHRLGLGVPRRVYVRATKT